MKVIANIAIVLGVISLIIGVVSRITFTPVAIVKGGLEAEAFLLFTNTCLLFAITFILLEMQKGK